MSGGASRYNPVMLLKVMIYYYMTGIYSSRQIAKQCRENINVMWLAGSQTPDFRTINKFRGEKYEKAKATFNSRNSYSKTDEDAMLNGQLKPGYNIQVGTENNFVTGYDVFPNPTDTRTLKPHLENVMKRLDCKFKTVIADAGYGSEENYDYLEEKEITGAIKYSTYEK